MDAHKKIKALAQTCAQKGLGLRDARLLFESLYVADALVLSQNNKTKSARKLGLNRERLYRIQKRAAVRTSDLEEQEEQEDE